MMVNVSVAGQGKGAVRWLLMHTGVERGVTRGRGGWRGGGDVEGFEGCGEGLDGEKGAYPSVSCLEGSQ